MIKAHRPAKPPALHKLSFVMNNKNTLEARAPIRDTFSSILLSLSHIISPYSSHILLLCIYNNNRKRALIINLHIRMRYVNNFFPVAKLMGMGDSSLWKVTQLDVNYLRVPKTKGTESLMRSIVIKFIKVML